MSSFLLAVLRRYCINFAGDDSFVAREAFVLRSSHIRYCRVIVSPATGRLTALDRRDTKTHDSEKQLVTNDRDGIQQT